MVVIVVTMGVSVEKTLPAEVDFENERLLATARLSSFDVVSCEVALDGHEMLLARRNFSA